MNARDLSILPRSCAISPGFSLVSDTHGMDKIAKLNTSLQLLVSFNPSQVPGLNKSNGGAADLVYILLANTNQLKKMGCYGEARGLLGRVQAEIAGGKSGDRVLQQLPVHVGYEQLVVDLLEAGEEGKRSQDLVKRGKENGAVFASVKERASLTMFLGQLQVPGLVNLVLSLLAAMHNAARDDPSTDILPTYVTLWPSGLASNVTLQDRQVDDVLTSVLTSALKNSPKDPQFLRMMADLQYANSHYASALALYVETAAVKTEFLQLDCGPTILEDTAVMRMVRCCTELGRLTQAVVLMQFTPDPNYAQAFKYLEDRDSADGSDSLYGCIWDMAVLEFAMCLHNRRGEVARRQQALNCIMQLELNTNNEEEIQKEAAKIRKAMFMRALALQFF